MIKFIVMGIVIIAILIFIIKFEIELFKERDFGIAFFIAILSIAPILMGVYCGVKIYQYPKDIEYTVVEVKENKINEEETITFVYLEEKGSDNINGYKYIGEDKVPEVGDIIIMNGFTLEDNYKNLDDIFDYRHTQGNPF